MKSRNLQESPIKTMIQSQLLDAPFKTAFKATLGFYAAQALISLVVLGGLALTIGIVVYFNMN